MGIRKVIAAHLNYVWRIAATGLCFASFGLGGLLLSITAFPLMHVLPLREGNRTGAARRLIHRSFRLFVWFMQACGVLRVTIEGRDKLRDLDSCLVIANHPTLIDVVILISLIPNCNCVVKQGLWRNPFLRGVVSAADYISNNESDGLIDECAQALRDAGTLIVFPEGTRSIPGEPLKFKRGAAAMAVRSHCAVLPVFITCTPPSLMKGQRWYQVPRESRVSITVRIGERFAVAPIVATADNATLAARKLNQHFQHIYSDAGILKEIVTHV